MPTRTTDPLIDRILAAYERDGTLPLLSGGDHDDSDDTDQTDADQREADDTDDDADTAELGDKGKAALKAERDARKAERDARKAAEKELADLKAEQQRAKDKEAAEQGKWQELAEKREADLTAATTERDALQSRLDEALQVIRDDVTATWKDTPEEVRDLYEGDEDDVLAKRRHLTRSAKLIARLTADKDKTRGNGPNPKPRGNQIDIDKETARTARRVRI